MRRVAMLALGAALLAVFFRHHAVLLLALTLATAGASIADPVALRGVLRLGALLAAIFAGAVTGGVVTLSAGWSRGLSVGSAMFLRLIVLALVAAVMARRVSADTVLRAAERLGLERVGLVLGLALNALPHLVEASRDVWAAQVARRPSRWGLVQTLPRLAEVLLAHTARIAEEAAAAAALRGHAALSRQLQPVAIPVRVVVVTGTTNAGKTTAMESVVDRIRRGRGGVAGFVQPGIWKGDTKTGFKIRDVASGSETLLATEVDEGQGDAGTRFRFDDEGFAAAKRALSKARAGDTLVIDELGPLELRGHGHMGAVRKALAVEGLTGVVVSVRRHLVPLLLAALDCVDAEVVDLAHHAAETPEVVLRALGAETR